MFQVLLLKGLEDKEKALIKKTRERGINVEFYVFISFIGFYIYTA